MVRGEVYRVRLPKGIGREQHGERYAIVVQADLFLPRDTVIIAPTSRSARSTSYRPTVTIEGTSTHVLVEQLSALDIGRLGSRVGELTTAETWSVDDALELVLGLNR